MFKKFFNSVETLDQSARTVTTILKPITSSEIQEEMHKELRFVLEHNQIEINTNIVNEIKDANQHIITKAQKLNNLGFINTPSVVVKQELDSQLIDKQKQIDLETAEIHLTNKYALKFPGYKFVPERIFNTVRDKYDLYTSEPDRYIKEIPEKNLDEIVNFMGTIKDTHELGYTWDRSWGGNYRFNRSIVNTEEECKAVLKRRTEGMSSTQVKSSYDNDCHYSIRPRTDLLQITAPINHFNLKNSEVKGREITTKRPVLDPIVSHKVEGGYIIVSAWDKEAEIPEIQNPMNN